MEIEDFVSASVDLYLGDSEHEESTGGESITTNSKQVPCTAGQVNSCDAEVHHTKVSDYEINDDDVDHAGYSGSRSRLENKTPESEAPELTDHGSSPAFKEPVTPKKRQRVMPHSKPAKRRSKKRAVTKTPEAEVSTSLSGRARPWLSNEERACFAALRKADESGVCTRRVDIWDETARLLKADYGVDRTSGGVKNYWNRYGRQKFKYDERALKNPRQLRTSLLPQQR